MARGETSENYDVLAVMIRNSFAVIVSVDDHITNVLGWEAEQLVGHPSTEFVHPEDQPAALATWFEMLERPHETHTWRGRYRTPEGRWRWVECVNVNRLDEADNPIVLTTMRRVTDQLSVAEQLRERTQLLNQLSDAMPVGMFQFDTDGSITFTNERLHSILGHPVSETLDTQFPIVTEDEDALRRAIRSVFAQEAVDDVELRFLRSSGGVAGEERVCLLSLRPLTDGTGSVTGAVGCVSDVTDQVELRRQLEVRANTDELTACLNRAAILDLLGITLGQKGDNRVGTAVIFVDLCRFKNINDSFGHDVGDHILELVAARLRAAVREVDGVGRFGGDEFLVICPGVDSAFIALEVAKRILATLTDRIDIVTGIAELGASIGVAWSGEPIDPDTLIAQADHAMYDAKRNGSSTVELFKGNEY
jgi:diguanylate cyclase (GGDEF)-like protein/PAS domain S-box-containing protein